MRQRSITRYKKASRLWLSFYSSQRRSLRHEKSEPQMARLSSTTLLKLFQLSCPSPAACLALDAGADSAARFVSIRL